MKVIGLSTVARPGVFSAAPIAVVLLLVWLPACSGTPKVKAREPLPLGPTIARQAVEATNQGSTAYVVGRYEEAKSYFAQAIAAAPTSGEAHYNLGLALFKLGETEEAREHFVQAANLSPGNKVIWDSPALSAYGSPEPTVKKKPLEREHSLSKPAFGGVGPR